MTTIMGEEGARALEGMGASMRATELGALAQVAVLLLSEWSSDAEHDTGLLLLDHLHKIVRSEVLLLTPPTVEPKK